MKKYGKKLMKFAEHKNVRLVLIALLIAYSAFLVPAYNERISPLFDSWVIRALFVLVIILVIPQDLILGVLLLLAFGVSMFVNYRNNGMRVMLESENGSDRGALGRRLGETVDASVGAVLDTTGRVVSGTVGVVGDVAGAADRATGSVVSGVARETERVARGVVGDIAGGLSLLSSNEPQGFNIGYTQCIRGTGDGMCRGVGNVGLQTQGLGVPVGFPGQETGAIL